jgi:hypothetical protein
VAELDGRADDHRIAGNGGKIDDEGPVDLDLIDGQLL